MILENGSMFLLDRRGPKDQVLEFETLSLPTAGAVMAMDRRSKAMSTSDLMHSRRPPDIAELQWRLSSPLISLLLALLGIRFSHTSQLPAGGTRSIVAIIVYALLFALFGVAHSLVDQGLVGAVPGLWWFYLPPLAMLWLMDLEPFNAMRQNNNWAG
jgi:lipopolysaccharide export system permease protein